MTAARPRRRRTRRAILLLCERCRIWTRYLRTDAPPDSDGRQTYRCKGCGCQVRR